MFFYYFTEVSDTVKIYGGSNKVGISNTKQAGISKIRIPYTAEEITPELVSKVLGKLGIGGGNGGNGDDNSNGGSGSGSSGSGLGSGVGSGIGSSFNG